MTVVVVHSQSLVQHPYSFLREPEVEKNVRVTKNTIFGHACQATMVLPLAIYLSVIICIVPVCLSYKTRPRIWPAATAEHYSERSLVLRTFTLETWNFKYTGSFWKPDAAILQAAEERFLQSLDHMIPKNPEAYSVNLHHYDLWPLLGTEIHITTDSNNTLVATDESYSIHIDNTNATTSYIQLAAPTHLGVLCGLQSLLQLLSFGWLDQTDSDRIGESSVVFVARNTPLTIHDTPTYSYRGLLIDTSRHYLPLSLILHNLNAMEMNKLNVLHWHITDSQSWPFLGDAFPELAMGAFCKACIYTTDDVTLIINEAKLRGIQVVVELDLPGHSQGK
jgi:hexosaminidase